MSQADSTIGISIRFEAQLRDLVDSNPAVLQCAPGTSLMAALRELASDDAVRTRLFPDSEAFSHSILVFRNNEPVDQQELSAVSLSDGDEIILFPPISGG